MISARAKVFLSRIVTRYFRSLLLASEFSYLLQQFSTQIEGILQTTYGWEKAQNGADSTGDPDADNGSTDTDTDTEGEWGVDPVDEGSDVSFSEDSEV